MSKLVKLLVYCAIFVFSDGSDCPFHDVFLNNPGNFLIYTCPENTVFSAAKLKCLEMPELNVKCTRSGRILDTSSNNCTSYLICTQLEDGSYDSKQVKCPIGMVFSSSVSRCASVNDYICPRTQENLRPNGCQGNGRFADSFSTNCSTYLICTQLEDGSYSPKQINCPIGMVFSPNVSRCVSINDYICPRNHENRRSTRGCQGNGRFADPLSTNCSTYLICTQLEDGSYSSKQINCPIGMVFSPNVSRCVSVNDYICPRSHENRRSTRGCQGNGRFADPLSTNCSTYLICTQLEDGSYSSKQINCPIGMVFSPNVSRCVSVNDYICPRSHENRRSTSGCQGNGRFADPLSTNCSTYVSCIQLDERVYGFNRTKCSIGMVFSPNVSRCVSVNDYICPRTYEKLRSNECHGNDRFADPFSTNCSTYLICTQLEDRSYSSKQINCPIGMVFSLNVSRCVSVNNYICPGSHENLRSDGCQGNGRFSDPLSVDCSTYLICTQLKDGSYSSNQVNCPAGNLFSPNVSPCIASTNYNCSTTKIRTNVNFQSSECHANGRFPDSSSINCTSYQICTQLDDGSYPANRVMCPIGTLFSSIISRCISNSNYTCPGIQNKTNENLQSSGCLENGRYPDPKAFNCSSYLICTQLGNGSYSSTEVTCPLGTIFSANLSRCISSTSYTCPGYKIQNTECLANGRFPDPSSANCSSYLICTHLEDGSYSSNQVFCPTETIFSHIVNRCVPSLNYTCSTAKNETHGNLLSSRCQANGRFPEPSSINCTSYQLCTQLDDGSYSSKQASCPSGTLFSSIVKRCVSNSSYICPSHSNGCRENGRFPDPNSANRSSYLICTQLANGTYSSSHVTCPPSTIFSSDLKRCVLFSNYTCSSEGLFSDPNSTDCSTYISCSKDLVPQTLKCPKYTLFSIEKHDCIIACDVMCHGTHNKSKEAATG